MSPELARLARHRLERAREAFREGEALEAGGSFRGAVSRFYYAGLHAARALLATREVDSARHSGVIALFQAHFVRTALIPADVARAFPRAFEKRLNTDYADFSDASADDASRVRTEIAQFIDACAALLDRLVEQTTP